MKRLLLICMLLALAMAASGLVSQVAGLSSGPGAAQATGPDEAFLRSVALIGQSSVGYAVAGPSNVPFGTLSMGPTEAEAYAWSLAQTGQGSMGQVAGLSSGPGAAQATGPDEAFLRSVALIGQGSVGYAVAGPSNVPFGTLSMGPTEAEAYAWSLAQTGQDSAGVASDR